LGLQLSSIIDALCEAGSEHRWLVNQQNIDGRTALHVVAARGQLSAVKCLLCRGAAIDLQDNDDNAVIHTALLAPDTTGTADIVAAICATEQAKTDKSFVKQHGFQRYYTVLDNYQKPSPSFHRHNQWSFGAGTRGNAVPVVKKLSERMGTAFPYC